ncbi:MAG: alkaline phosphatase family protein [Calditrichaeota bacterium]|nr:MAG: alkaline phosphatase family protein [Calditrichota bacterium]
MQKQLQKNKIEFLLLIIFVFIPHILYPAENPTLILISFDGFRWDYTERGLTPNLDLMAQNGVKASSLQPTFPSKTFPNHLSIVTGMYTENHGIIYNDIYDPFTGRLYKTGNNAENRQGRWYLGEAIWETLQRQGIRTSSYFWPGSEIEEHERHPIHFEQYEHNRPYEDRIRGVLQWLQLPEDERPAFITLYFHETDSYGHRFGPDSPQVNNAIALLDSMLGTLITGLKKQGQLVSTNIIVVADHGMTALSKDKVIRIDEILPEEKYEIMGIGPMIGLRPAEERLEAVFHKLQKNENHFHVYKRADVPEWFHYSQHPFIPPLILIADMGWTMTTQPIQKLDGGNHGYDNYHIDMHGLFHAMGPAFKNGYKAGTLRNIDLYPLICQIFNVIPRQNIDGKLENIGFILKD